VPTGSGLYSAGGRVGPSAAKGASEHNKTATPSMKALISRVDTGMPAGLKIHYMSGDWLTI